MTPGMSCSYPYSTRWLRWVLFSSQNSSLWNKTLSLGPHVLTLSRNYLRPAEIAEV